MQQNIRVYNPVQGTEIESTGIQLPDITTLLVDNSTGANTVTIQITLSDIQGSTNGISDAVWVTYTTVTTSNIHYEVFEYGPTGIKITGSDGETKVWVKV